MKWAFHALATDAVKYGAPTNEVGRIRLDRDVVDGAQPEALRPTYEVRLPGGRPQDRRRTPV